MHSGKWAAEQSSARDESSPKVNNRAPGCCESASSAPVCWLGGRPRSTPAITVRPAESCIYRRPGTVADSFGQRQTNLQLRCSFGKKEIPSATRGLDHALTPGNVNEDCPGGGWHPPWRGI
ncbi:hypothetical protein ZHAS_00006128 [Anopheles sinensis]|uniref:Uncharacterized protein n=1 Tax=Anopheles sinensis TaxID=74873 RepID=A0A084VL86_ANOSI|nr:hypothetical protein ZHAS_00006128 [Anopheles sinensis]